MEELWGQRELKEFAALNSMYAKSGNAEAHEKAEARTETLVRQLRGVYTFIKKSRSTMSARTRNSPPSQKPHTGHAAY